MAGRPIVDSVSRSPSRPSEDGTLRASVITQALVRWVTDGGQGPRLVVVRTLWCDQASHTAGYAHPGAEGEGSQSGWSSIGRLPCLQ